LLQFLLSLTGNDHRMCNLLRAGFRRALEPCVHFQTGIWLQGPPASGKSTVTSWLKYVLQDRCVEFNCHRTSLFDRANLIGANCITISDGESITIESARILKTRRFLAEIRFLMTSNTNRPRGPSSVKQLYL
jgi:phage/plasmid-associated DNA primase